MVDPSSHASDSEGSECSCCSLPATPEDLLTPALREELESRVIDHRITVEQFVRTVYGVDNALIQRVLARNVTFSREHLQEYLDGLARGEANETSCRPFQAIFDACVRAVREELDITDDPPLKLFTETRGCFEGCPQRMPGGIFLAPAACRGATRIAWGLVHHVLVFEDNCFEGDESSEGAFNDLKERSGSYDLDTASHHRKPTPSLSSQELKGAQYALECMNADTSRYYATVLCVDGTKVWLLYIDRDFVSRTTSFDFVESPQLFAVAAYAMLYCTPVQAGFDPHLHFPVTTADGTSNYLNAVAYPRELAGAQFVFPESQGQPALSFTVKSLSPVYRDAIPSVRDAVTYALKDTNSDGEEMELKVCWTPRGRTPEPIILKTLHKTLPDMVDHLPVLGGWRVVEPTCSLLALLDEKTRIDCLEKSRRVVYQVTPRFMPLWELNSVEEFKECFVDIVEVHHRAFERGGIIHSNIGEHSAMMRRERGRALGVLKDWDRAQLPNDLFGPPHHQFETGTFIAVELQQNAGTQHRYHHDLESFLFLLVWATLHFGLESKRRLPSKLPDWQGEWQTAALKKRSFITDPDTFNEVTVPTCMEATVPRHNPLVALPMSQVTATLEVGDPSKNGNFRSKFPFLAARLTPGRFPGLWLPPLRNVTPEGRLLPYTGVVAEWVFPLVRLFRDAMRAADVVKVDAEGIWERHFDEDIYAEKITFEAFMRAIGRTPRK
ncbi:uncharacterized protein SCHCODRAFT_02515142 [Schizophyllum commune H4-8]|nr:uncharacterized protein SCHCODRAFT_02515142 [Schizophyllum commune H4-8]KAI5887851.1 hypothetical protein SCHCODRAFT_02515142 [Schizophyllum commune H4-8]